ncbi:hypothetical protein NLG97_g5765 [Lecanicillium saksenae]|uniref:Uncharacterized protein n=1 Tax=Lecanicillium saksenae TaxID=468837 RepID=A0ACC1QTG2_9HYPO|nr:hypothetical protein NLG97_g5765 [Lecanicillium saksenae]
MEHAVRTAVSSSPSSEQSSDEVSSAGNANPPKEAPRQKKWAVKVKTGCLTCRTRRVKCDEAKPACQRCLKSGHKCRGYTVVAQSQKKPLKFAVNIAPDIAREYEKGHSTFGPVQRGGRLPRRLREAEPPDWDYIESFRYFYSVIQPHRDSELDADHDQHLPSARTSVRPIFIISTLAHRISNASKAYGRMQHAGENPALTGAWENYFRFVLEVIGIVNECINDKGPYGGYRGTFSRIVDLVALEIELQGAAWGAHTEGFLAFLEHYGGVQEVLRLPRPPLYQFQFVFVHGLAANTTSPAHKQISGFTKLADDDIRVIVGNAMFIDMPCPTDLFLEMVHITRLRVLVDSGTILTAHIKTIASKIFDRIDDFEPESWTESYKLSTAPVITNIARAYKAAVMMYGILTLPASAYVSWSAARGVLRPYRQLLVTQRSDLLAHARKTWSVLSSQSALCWPLIVAGVALANGPLEDQEFVSTCLRTIWLHPNAYCGPIVCLDKLHALWQSGKTGWEDCFDEPVPPIP